MEQDRERLRVEVPQPPIIPRSKLGLERIRHRFLRRVAARRQEPDPDRLALPAPAGEVVVIEERGIVERPRQRLNVRSVASSRARATPP